MKPLFDFQPVVRLTITALSFISRGTSIYHIRAVYSPEKESCPVHILSLANKHPFLSSFLRHLLIMYVMVGLYLVGMPYFRYSKVNACNFLLFSHWQVVCIYRNRLLLATENSRRNVLLLIETDAITDRILCDIIILRRQAKAPAADIDSYQEHRCRCQQ